MGKLIDRLNKCGKSAGPRLGFGARNESAAPVMALIAALPAADPDLVKRAADQGADAVVVAGGLLKRSKGGAPRERLAPEMVPCGTEGGDTAAEQAGAFDFAVVSAADSVGSLLNDSELDVVLRLPREISDDLLRTLEALPVDAFAVNGPETAITVEALVPYYRIAQATTKPVLVSVRPNEEEQTLRVLRDAGAVGVIVQMTAETVGSLAAMRKAINALPPKPVKVSKSRAVATVRLPGQPVPEPDEHQHDDDGDDE